MASNGSRIVGRIEKCVGGLIAILSAAAAAAAAHQYATDATVDRSADDCRAKQRHPNCLFKLFTVTSTIETSNTVTSRSRVETTGDVTAAVQSRQRIAAAEALVASSVTGRSAHRVSSL